jgi:hypothetical protein
MLHPVQQADEKETRKKDTTNALPPPGTVLLFVGHYVDGLTPAQSLFLCVLVLVHTRRTKSKILGRGGDQGPSA